jgi:hypothetical protein
MEKSSKNLISVFGEKPARGLPKPPPPPHLVEKLWSLHVERAIPGRGHGIRTRIWDTEKGEENNAKLNNSSTEQHFDARKIAITFLLLIALTNCAYLLSASLEAKTASYIVRAEPIKGSPR